MKIIITNVVIFITLFLCTAAQADNIKCEEYTATTINTQDLPLNELKLKNAEVNACITQFYQASHVFHLQQGKILEELKKDTGNEKMLRNLLSNALVYDQKYIKTATVLLDVRSQIRERIEQLKKG